MDSYTLSKMVAGDRFELPMHLAYETGVVTTLPAIKSGSRSRDRTYDQLINSQLHYRCAILELKSCYGLVNLFSCEETLLSENGHVFREH